MKTVSSLDYYCLLGRSGLRVSPLSLGTMTFGRNWGWGIDIDESRKIFDVYVDSGGNAIDTAIGYTNGTSEQLVGKFAAEKCNKLVTSTKYAMLTQPGDPNSGGNDRLNMVRSVETSLNRLRTDRIDLFYLHVWDGTTRPEEVMRGPDDFVRGGEGCLRWASRIHPHGP
jgi:aryl-alcohol dehydrogenase-like predicted oxidoreductase